MRKVVFLQNEGNVVGGVWFVNKTIGEELIRNDYEVHIISIRNGLNPVELSYDEKLHVEIINDSKFWGYILGKDIKKSIRQLKFIKAIKQFILRQKEKKSLKQDFINCKKRLEQINPDYIIASHYQMLDAIPESMLNKTVHEQHSSFSEVINNPANYGCFKKYNNKIHFLWLSKATLKLAEEHGLLNNHYIYNPSRICSKECADVVENKKLITIARLSRQKRLDDMIDIAKKVFENKHLSDWSLEIYGDGELQDFLNKMIDNHRQIRLVGRTDTPKEVLLKSSINLNTSDWEGFAMSIIEADECGVPTISFNYGESVYEQIENGNTGIVIENRNIEKYVDELVHLMEDPQYLKQMSLNAKKNSELYKPENVVKEWIKLFQILDKER